jgi:hypothetical protein
MTDDECNPELGEAFNINSFTEENLKTSLNNPFLLQRKFDKRFPEY